MQAASNLAVPKRLRLRTTSSSFSNKMLDTDVLSETCKCVAHQSKSSKVESTAALVSYSTTTSPAFLGKRMPFLFGVFVLITAITDTYNGRALLDF